METYIVTFIILIIIILLFYARPLIAHRLKTKKIKLVVVGKDGKRKVNILYLYPNDPLWEVVNKSKGVENVR